MSDDQDVPRVVAAAEAAVSSVTDPELKRIAFEWALARSSRAKPSPQPSPLEGASRLIQVVSVVAGVIISVLSFNSAREKDALARQAEAEARTKAEVRYANERGDVEAKRNAEAAATFLKLRQEKYLEAVEAAAILASPDGHTAEEVKKARTDFRDLYVAELSLVEGTGVATAMANLAEHVAPELRSMSQPQRAAYDLSHALRDSLLRSWGFQERVLDLDSR